MTKKSDKKMILVGTRNEAKFRMVKECMPKLPGYKILSLNDIQAIDDSALIEENNFEKNAKMKAEFYFKATSIPTLSTDHILWVEKWPKDKGFIIHMRKEANPKSSRATDEEVITFMQKFLGGVRGESKANFHYAIAFADKKGTSTWVSKQRNYILQAKQSKTFWPGYPIESLLVDAETGEYKGDQKNEIRYDSFTDCLAHEVKDRILK